MADHTVPALNASGFLFQLRVEEEVVRSADRHGWRVAAREHPWKHDKTERTGFADLVLATDTMRFVVECKRTRGATWYFIVPAESDPVVQRAEVYWIDDVPQRGQRLGWDPVFLRPPTFESSFCVIRGSGEGDEPLLERIGGMLIDAIEALGREEVLHLRGSGRMDNLVYVPVLITTATLRVARCNISSVSLETGEIPTAAAVDVPFLRFRKALSNRFPWPSKVADLRGISEARQRTLFIVNASALSDFLRAFDYASSNRGWPWAAASNADAPLSQDLWF